MEEYPSLEPSITLSGNVKKVDVHSNSSVQLFDIHYYKINCRLFDFRGGKATVFEGGVRVPAFLYGPKSLFPKSVDYDGIFHISDFYPTLLNMIGKQHILNSQHHKTLDGISQFEALNNVSIKYPRRSVHIHR